MAGVGSGSEPESELVWKSRLRSRSRLRQKPLDSATLTTATMPDKRVDKIKACIKDYPDFPKKGIVFKDIMPLMRDPSALTLVIDIFEERIRNEYINQKKKIDAIVGIESRGFFFGPLISTRLDIPFVAVRKPGKLPGKCISHEYTLEYGKDTLQVQADALEAGSNVIVVDDLLATGGTMSACVALMKAIKANVLECFVVIELSFLPGRKNVEPNVTSIVQIDE